MLNLTLVLRRYALVCAADKVPTLQLCSQRMSKQLKTQKVQFKNTKKIQGDEDTQMHGRTAVCVCAFDKRRREARLQLVSFLKQNWEERH